MDENGSPESSDTDASEEDSVSDGSIDNPTARVLSATPYENSPAPFTNVTEEDEETAVADTSEDSIDENAVTSQADEAAQDKADAPDSADEQADSDHSSQPKTQLGSATAAAKAPVESATVARSAQSAPSVNSNAIREEVKNVKDRVAFLRRIAERQTTGSDESPAATGQLAVAKEIESELDRILNKMDT